MNNRSIKSLLNHSRKSQAISRADVTSQFQIDMLKKKISDTDYKIIKCHEYALVGKDIPYDIEALHAERQALRDRINELEGGD